MIARLDQGRHLAEIIDTHMLNTGAADEEKRGERDDKPETEKIPDATD